MPGGNTGTLIFTALLAIVIVGQEIAALDRFTERERHRMSQPCPEFAAATARCAAERATNLAALSAGLLGNLPSRSRWPAHAPALASHAPDAEIALPAADGRYAVVQAWSRHSSGLGVPIMQVDGDGNCYVLDEAEFAALAALASAPESP